jgi:uncharacterized repeat protein (TIGR01451 family)
MPQSFYDQLDAAGIMVDGGFQCCDAWAPLSSGEGVTSQEYHVMYLSALTIGQQLRDHPCVIDFSWSDNEPIHEQEAASEAGFAQSGFEDPIVSSAEYNSSGIYGPSGEKEGPYDWVPPSYWYATTEDSNTSVDNDPTETNVGGAFGFDSEEGSGDTVPTMDSVARFMSPSEEAALWKCPGYHQFHTNYESSSGDCPAAGIGIGTPVIGEHSGYAFGTLYNLDTAIRNRYGRWSSLAQFVEEAQVQNYEDTRAQFEAYIDHWDNYPTPSTGTDYWQMNKGWPTLLWDLYNYDYDEAGAYFGAKKANETLHVLYALDTGGVTIDNLSGATASGLSVESRVYDMSGTLTADQTVSNLTLSPQQVQTGVLTPSVPAATTPPTPAKTYFVELLLRQDGVVVDRNVYWLSTQKDVLNWGTTEGNPQADNGSPLSRYADMQALQSLPSESVKVAAATVPQAGPDGDNVVTDLTITNPASNPAVAFFLRADVRRGNPNGTEQTGDNEVLPVTYSDNDITLWPGQSETIQAAYDSAGLNGATPVVSLFGWNVGTGGCGTTQTCSQSPIVVRAPESAAASAAQRAATMQPAVQYFAVANGTPLLGGSASAQVGGSGLGANSASLLSVTETADSHTTSPSTSFTEGNPSDTYTVTVTNVGRVPTDGTTPVVVTDVIGTGLRYISMSGTGWTCSSSLDPTITCDETAGAGRTPVVLQPGQSYPPLRLQVGVAATAGFGSQGSYAGLHVMNAVSVTGGSASKESYSIAQATPIVGRPDLTNDYALDGAFRQGDATDQYQETVINEGAGATNGKATSPITSVFSPGAGETIRALYGSGWTCNLNAITSPYNEPADTCYSTGVLEGENGEEPPITEVVSVSPTAGSDTKPASEPKVVTRGGGAVSVPSTRVATVILAATAFGVTSSHSGTFAQGEPASYTLTAKTIAGSTTLGQVVLTDTLPAGVTATAMSGSGWTCPSVLLATLPTCYRDDPAAAGTTYPVVTLAVAVAGDAPTGTATNTVSVSGGGAFSAASGTDPTIITGSNPPGTFTPPQPPVLTVASSHSGSFAEGDSADAYTLTVSNGPSAGATYGLVSVTDTLPAGLNAVEISGTGWTCSLDPVILTPSPNSFEPVVSCFRLDFLAAGSSFPPITLVASVTDNAPASLTNTESVSGGGMSSPVSATDPTAITQLPELVVASFASSGGLAYAPFTEGDGPSAGDAYNVSVANEGFAPTTGTVSFAANLPYGLTPYILLAPTGWICTTATATCSTSSPMAAGAVADITVQVTVSSTAPQWLQPQMQASGGGEVPAAQLDLDNDYDLVDNGGEFAQQTFITPHRPGHASSVAAETQGSRPTTRAQAISMPAARLPSTTASSPSALTRISGTKGEIPSRTLATAAEKPGALPIPPPNTIISGSTTAMITPIALAMSVASSSTATCARASPEVAAANTRRAERPPARPLRRAVLTTAAADAAASKSPCRRASAGSTWSLESGR